MSLIIQNYHQVTWLLLSYSYIAAIYAYGILMCGSSDSDNLINAIYITINVVT